jgi:hypothetical protein
VRFAANGLLVFNYLGVGDDLHDFALVVEGCDGLTGEFLSGDIFEGEGLVGLLGSAAVDN